MGPAALNLGARGSPLARLQADEAIAALRPLFPPETVFATTWFETPGDRDLATPLSDPSVPTDFFTADLDRALLKGRIDLAVHSAKDLPSPLPAGLTVAARTRARDIRDALVFRPGEEGLPPRVVGASSPRRAETVRALYPDTVCQDLRGDVPARIRQLDEGAYDAIVVAACALERLGLADRIGRYLPGDPLPQQGRLALVIRADDTDLVERLRPIDVVRTAGLVAIVACPSDPALLPARALQYLAQADIILHAGPIPAATLPRVGDRAVALGGTDDPGATPPSEIHRRLLSEAESGKLVVFLHGGESGAIESTLAFLDAWDIRADAVPAPAPAPRPARGLTLFVGSQPERFAAHGPLVHWPLARLEASPAADRAVLLRDRLPGADGVLFPSPFSVTAFLAGLHAAGLDVRALAGKALLAVGPATASELKGAGLLADLAADSTGGVRELAHRLTRQFTGRYLYPCSDQAPTAERIAALAAHGIRLEPVVFYRHIPLPVRPLPDVPFTRVLFASPSAVREYFRRYPTERDAPRAWLAIGPTTLDCLASLGLHTQSLASEPSPPLP